MEQLLAQVSETNRLIRDNRYINCDRARAYTRRVGPFAVPDTSDVHPDQRGPFVLSIATNPDDIIDNFQVRYQSYKENEYLNPKYEWEQELECDEHDAHAALFLGRHELTRRVHSAARLVFDVDGALPMDEYYSLDAWRERVGYHRRDDLKVVEFSRLISHPIHQKELNKAMVRFVFEWAVREGVTHVVGFGRFDIKHYYDKWGFEDITPYEPLDVRAMDGALIPPMKFYPHAMDLANLRWDHI